MGISISVKKKAEPDAPAETTQAATGGKSDVSTKGAAAITKKASKAADKKDEAASATTTVKATTTKATKNTKTGKVTSEESHPEGVEVPAEVLNLDKTEATKIARVGVESSYTHGLPNFSSCKVGVSIELPCAPAQINDVYEYGSTWVASRLNQMMIGIGAAEAPEDADQAA